MQAVFDRDQQRKKQAETQNAELAEFAGKIKKMFQASDPNGTGVISRAALAKVFRELDGSWTSEDLDEMLTIVGGTGSDIRYADFVDWFMEEDDPKLRKQLWQHLSNAFATSDAEEQDDPEDSDNAEDELEDEEELEELGIDLDELITYDLWQGVLGYLDIDEDEGKELYEDVEEEMREKGVEDGSKGFPLREYLEELKIETDDREGVLEFQKALAKAKDDLANARKPKNQEAKPAGVDAATVRTMFDKVVRELDHSNLPAEEGFRIATGGTVRLSKAEASVLESWHGREDAFIEKVKAYMLSPPVVNATAGQTVCKQSCIAEVERIAKKFEESGTKFIDPDWNVKSSPNAVLYVDKEKPGYDCTVGIPVKWKRLTDIVKNSSGGTSGALGSLFGGFAGGSKKKKRPALFKGGIKAGDIIQGNIGTCFLLGAMGALASTKEEAVQRMFIKYDVDAGVYGVRFNVDGEWSYVIVDDFMPVDYDGNLMFAHCKDAEEVWVPLLEKAFCKLHTCFEMCDGGQSAEAIASMLGGVGGRFVVKKKHRRNPGTYFKVLKQAAAKGWLLTTGFVPRGPVSAGAGKCGEAVLPTGLVGGHAYSVCRVVEAKGHQLVCCRNPWGTGEWTGKWSDENAEGEWTEEMKAATGYRGLDDGRFWMSIEDFVANTAGAEYARTFGPNWKKVTQYKHFRKAATLATAQYDYEAKDRNEIGFREGDKIEVTAFTGDWWKGNVKGRGKEGYFPGNYVKMDDRPVNCFELSGVPNEGLEGPMTAVVMLLQPKVHLRREWTKRKEDGLNYKNLTYPALQLVVIGPDGSIAVKKEGHRRCVWGELKLPGGGKWRIYALSTDGQGDVFLVRAYLKDGTASLKEIPGVSVNDLMGVI